MSLKKVYRIETVTIQGRNEREKFRSHHGQVLLVKITFIYVLLSKTIRSLYLSLKKKIRSRVWINRKNQSISMLMNNSNKNVLHSVACQSLHNISKHVISLDEKRQKYFSFLNKFPIVITHNYMKFLPRNATQKLWCI